MNADAEFDATHRLITKCIPMWFTDLFCFAESFDRRTSAFIGGCTISSL
jgi:hypothetical protein